MNAGAAARGRVARTLWQAVWLDRRRTVAALVLLVLAKLSSVLVPLVLKAVIDRFSRPESLAESVAPAAAPAGVATALVLPVFLLLAYSAVRFAGTLFTELRDLVFARVTQRTVTAFAERTFAHLLNLSPRFHTQRSTGSLIRNVERGTAGIALLLGAGLFTVVPTLVEFIGVVAVMAAGYSLWFTLIIMLTFFAYGALTMALTQTRALRQRRVNAMDSQASGRMVDSLLNYETVKTYAREGYERSRYAADLAAWAEGSVSNQRSLSVLHIAQSAVIALGVAGVMLLAGQQTVLGAMSVGDLVLVNAYVIQICLPLNALGFVFRETRDALVDTEALFALLDERSDIEDSTGQPPLAVAGGHVRFENVDFGYEPGRQILYGVSLDIGAGQTVAVVGGSGSGKSTLARLLLRLYDVGAGRISIDGQDIRQVQLASLRQAIGVVPQDTVLFNDSIAQNIGYGRIGAGTGAVVEAAQAAQVHEFILSLPQQYDTVVGERGLMLSGGEKQRIAIARAFLKNPPIMVFDEATSALDTRAERAIQGELDRIAKGRSTLVIAHRLSTVVNADQIVVMDKGRIVERGRHEELLERNGLYAQLWKLQRQQQQFERLERRLARRPVNLALLLASVVDGLRSAFEPRGVQLYSDIGMDDARVAGDPSALAHTFWELGVHALEATPSGGRIELRLARHGLYARLALTDGRHAAPGDAAGGGERAESAMDPMLLRSTIERQGGRFAIEPASSLHGMRFVIDLPLHALSDALPGEALPPHAAHAPEGSALQGLQVMVVEDGPDARESLQALLELEGAEVLAFGGGQEALQWLDAQPTARWPDLLVCDIALDDLSGLDVMHRVRQAESARGVALGERLPAVALTGLADEHDRQRALLAGFQFHLGKPVAPRELVGTLSGLARSRPGQSRAVTTGNADCH